MAASAAASAGASLTPSMVICAVCATLPCQGMSLTAEAWGQLEPGTRTLFKRYAPPVRYIGAKEDRPD